MASAGLARWWPRPVARTARRKSLTQLIRPNGAFFASARRWGGCLGGQTAYAKNRNPQGISMLIRLSRPRRENISLSFFRNKWLPPVIPLRSRGAFWPIVVEREAGCDGRGGDAHELSCGRTAPTRTAKACGPGTPGLVPSLRGDDLAGDGD